MRKTWFAFSFILLIILDRLTKRWALHNFQYDFLDLRFLRFRLVYNTGTAFGLGERWGLFWLILSTGILLCIVVFFIRKFRAMTHLEFAGFCFIIPGALSNIVDRFLLGAVVDFIDFKVWPVFNLADTWITLGIFILGYKFFIDDKKNTRQVK